MCNAWVEIYVKKYYLEINVLPISPFNDKKYIFYWKFNQKEVNDILDDFDDDNVQHLKKNSARQNHLQKR